ncbi:MAG: methylated-DNA--[protein]-cysteine S-methyltransferase [Puniceicoccales bacterium]
METATLLDRPTATTDRELKSHAFETPLGGMIAIASDEALLLLEFNERRALEAGLERVASQGNVSPGRNAITDQIERELGEYFAGERQVFETPIELGGTAFQQEVWRALMMIPYGETWSYRELAQFVGKPTGSRAVAGANGANQLAIIVPCHRVIGADGSLSGYAGGVERKQRLLEIERAMLL